MSRKRRASSPYPPAPPPPPLPPPLPPPSLKAVDEAEAPGASSPPRKRPRRTTPGGGRGGARASLPAKIIPFANRDKLFHETWYKGRDWLDIPHPFRMLLAARPNGGKTTVILNVILRVACGKTPFEKIVVVHCDPNTTKEYQDVDHEQRSDIPRPDEFDPTQKTLCILEDLNYTGMGKDQQGYLERLVGYVSTHKNVSVMLTAQDPFRIIPVVRRCANIFVLWNHHDEDMLRTLARKTGRSMDTLKSVLTNHCQAPHDHVWIDLTPDSPAPFRKNGYETIPTQLSQQRVIPIHTTTTTCHTQRRKK